MPACCPPCPKGLQRKISPLHPYRRDQGALVRAGQIRQRQNAYSSPQRIAVTALDLSSYWHFQSHRRREETCAVGHCGMTSPPGKSLPSHPTAKAWFVPHRWATTGTRR